MKKKERQNAFLGAQIWWVLKKYLPLHKHKTIGDIREMRIPTETLSGFFLFDNPK